MGSVGRLEFRSMKNHRLIDERSLAFDRLVLTKLRRDPALVEMARANLGRWMDTASPGVKPALAEWMRLLDGSPQALFAALTGTDEKSTRLRQSSPFCGMLTLAERSEIIREFQKRDSIPT